MTRLLVVDDESEICDFLKMFFEDRGFEVAVANSGQKALQLSAVFNPHVILLDIHMPGVDGLTVLREIKHKQPDIKVVMVTAIETRDKIEEAMRLGADNYITKPLSLDYLEKDVQEKVAQLAKSGKILNERV